MVNLINVLSTIALDCILARLFEAHSDNNFGKSFQKTFHLQNSTICYICYSNFWSTKIDNFLLKQIITLSVTRLGDFRKFLTTDFLIDEAQIL